LVEIADYIEDIKPILNSCQFFIRGLVLSESEWQNGLTTEDKRALTPLFYTHVNPYGTFNLNMEERLIIEPR